GNGGLLQDRVGSINAVGDAAKFDNRDGGVFLHTILNAPTSVQRRQREKLFGVVIPSPVGLAMVNDVGPSPLNPSPACDGPLLPMSERSMSASWRGPEVFLNTTFSTAANCSFVIKYAPL